MITNKIVNKQYAGGYLIDGMIDGTILLTIKKPSFFNRIMTKWLIGWKWVSVENLKSSK